MTMTYGRPSREMYPLASMSKVMGSGKYVSTCPEETFRVRRALHVRVPCPGTP
jgi:hypothetical protein